MKQKYIDIPRLLNDHGIEYHPASNGWINLPCPFCYKGDGKFGLGWNGKGFNCFHCGRLDRLEVLKSLLNTDTHQTLHTLSSYQRGTRAGGGGFDSVLTVSGGTTDVKLPYGTAPLSTRHTQYLISRDFDPEQLIAEWGLQGTGPVGPYAHRIIIPVCQGGRLVSYQGRDITGRAAEKYKSCPDKDSVISIKNCLYGIDRIKGTTVVVTEGPTKVWRLGAGATCTFGATVTSKQIESLSRYRRVFILFDEDEAGQEGGNKLAHTLAALGIKPTVLTVGIKDVAELKQSDANELMNSIK